MSIQCDDCGGWNEPATNDHATNCPRRQRADHGISPAKLLEKVEQLEDKLDAFREHGDELQERLDIALKRIDDLGGWLEGALKRIELLERDMHDVHPNALSGEKP